MFELKVFLRDIKAKAKQRRRLGFIPGIIYGHQIKNLLVEVPTKDFQKVYHQAGESTLLTLKIEKGKPRQVLIHGVQTHPLTDAIEHVDFYQVKADEKVFLEIGLRLIGVPPAVQEKGGILVTPLNKLKVECLPADLVHEVEVDLSSLREINEMIRVKDLKVSSKIRVLNNPEEVVAVIEALRVEEKEKPEEVPVITPEEKVTAEKGLEKGGTEKAVTEKTEK